MDIADQLGELRPAFSPQPATTPCTVFEGVRRAGSAEGDAFIAGYELPAGGRWK